MPRKPTGVQVDVDKFIELRKAKEMSQEELANVATVSVKCIQRAESGENISIENLGLIAPTGSSVANARVGRARLRPSRGLLPSWSATKAGLSKLGVWYKDLIKAAKPKKKIRGTLTIEVDEDDLKSPEVQAAFLKMLAIMAKLQGYN